MTPEIDAHQTAYGKMKKRQVIINNFLGGLAWGVGSVLGATIIISIIVGVLQNFNFIPGVQQLIDDASNSRPARQIEKAVKNE